MKRSIHRSFEHSGISSGEVEENRKDAWGGSIYNRAKAIGFKDAYGALFGSPSHAVHGNWQDLLRFHLIRDGEEFTPNLHWMLPRPQMLLAACRLSLDACRMFTGKLLPECDDSKKIEDLITDINFRVDQVDKLHEKFLQRKRGSGQSAPQQH